PPRPAQQLPGVECDPNDWRWRVLTEYSDRNDALLHQYIDNQWEAHHGVPSAWMARVFGTDYRANDAPAVLMPVWNHRFATKLWNDIGRNLDPSWSWDTISWFTTQWIAQQMFQDTGTPQDCEDNYWDMFKKYAIRLICKKALALGADV